MVWQISADRNVADTHVMGCRYSTHVLYVHRETTITIISSNWLLLIILSVLAAIFGKPILVAHSNIVRGLA
jgi:hypothetical protein